MKCGEGRPVILLHGWSGNHRHIMSDSEPIFQQRTGWQRIYLDLPAWPDAEPSLDHEPGQDA
jgi:pimeloyl-ACP methyl ester carboxylesterase